MAKAVFHKHQRVFVKPVGTWAIIEQVKPHWVKDVEEPVRIHYDCGLGRDFRADDLSAEEVQDDFAGQWRLMRARNKWQTPEECAHHPVPGTYPIVVTDSQNWGGWRVPGAEYDRDPGRIEFQARLIANAPRLMGLLEAFARLGNDMPDAPADLVSLARHAKDTLRHIKAEPTEFSHEDPAPPPNA
ncbi:hypothetical protein [Woodsholea maritima]|uniref:hypothetical protein n=1 Tax=Woodsholea maritima TaxID=240237 RepID=UPI00037CCDDB|nr:hypothetical protein [Woodsholea maritima]